MLIREKCPKCGTIRTMVVNSVDALAVNNYYNNRGQVSIETALPRFNPMEREFVMTGYCPNCQKQIFNSAYESARFFKEESLLTLEQAKEKLAPFRNKEGEGIVLFLPATAEYVLVRAVVFDVETDMPLMAGMLVGTFEALMDLWDDDFDIDIDECFSEAVPLPENFSGDFAEVTFELLKKIGVEVDGKILIPEFIPLHLI